MVASTLLFGTVFSFLTATIYFYIGRTLSRRQIISPNARLAWRLFVVWWYALAGITFAGGLLSLMGALGFTDLALFLTFTQISLLGICLALCGLMYYLVYLYTGNDKVITPLAVFYMIFYILLLYYVNSNTPTGVSIGKWTVQLQYQQQGGPIVLFLVVLLVFPQIVCALAYLSLYFRVKEITQKYRIALVSVSIIIWFLSIFVGTISGLAPYDWWQVTSRLVGLAATLVILMAYKPLPWVKTRWGISSIADDSGQ